MNVNPSSFIRQQIQFQCPICSQIYDDNLKFPMMICLSQHSCCLKCINGIFKKSESSECPFCKQKIVKSEIKKFRLLHEIRETANKLKNMSEQISQNKMKNYEQISIQLCKQRQKNNWLIQQMRQRQGQWLIKLKNISEQQQKLRQQLNLKRYQIEHLRSIIHDQYSNKIRDKIKQNNLISKNIKNIINLHKQYHQIRFQHFQIIRKLAKGDYSIIYLARDKKLGLLCSIKVIQKWIIKQLNLQQSIIRQIKAGLYLQHPNILKNYGYFSDQKNVYIIAQLASDQNLATKIKKKQKINQISILRQIVLGVNQLIYHEIAHNELCGQTIILSFGDVVKITGFGWSTFEVDNKDNKNYQRDIRAIGFLCYQLIHPQMSDNIKSSKLRKEIQNQVKNSNGKSNMQNFLKIIFDSNKNTYNIISSIVNHPFLIQK